jgi:hypothetical protein
MHSTMPCPSNVDTWTLNQLLALGLMSELSYLPADEAERAVSLEADLIAAAKAEEPAK